MKTPLRNVEGLTKPIPEVVYRVSSARIILADYNLIRNDFPETKAMSEEAIDKWLLSKTAFMSEAQVRQTRVNFKIPLMKDTTGQEITTSAFRPQIYGRGLVFKTENGLIDGKGFGSKAPRNESHRSGLASLGEVIREFLFQKKVQQILDHSGSGLQTIGCYAVIDWGFSGLDTGTVVPMGGILRQAHTRPELNQHTSNHFANTLDSKRIEEIFRHYGLTSTGDSYIPGQEHVNIQRTKTGELIDFGAYKLQSRFQGEMIYYASEIPLNSPQSSTYVQPNPKMALAQSHWGASESGREHPRFDNPWIWSHRLAQDLSEGKATREHVTLHFENMMKSGSLPEETRGFAKDFNSPAAIQRAFRELFELHMKAPKFFVDTGLVKEFFKIASDAEKLSLAERYLALESGGKHKEIYLDHLIDTLEDDGLIERNPKLLEKIATVNHRWEGVNRLKLFLKHDRADLLQKMISEKKIAFDYYEQTVLSWIEQAASAKAKRCTRVFSGF